MRCHYKRICICFYLACVLMGTILIFFSYRNHKLLPPIANRSADDYWPDDVDDEQFWLDNGLFWSSAGAGILPKQRDDDVQHEEFNRLNYDGWQRVERRLNFDLFQDYLSWRRARQPFGRDLSRLLVEMSRRKGPAFFDDCHQSRPGGRRKRRTGRAKKGAEPTSWTEFFDNIGTCDLYGSGDQSDRILNNLLNDMKEMPFVAVRNLPKGTQVKLELTFENGHKAVMKPMRFGRSYETHPNHFYFSDFERHNAEVATFHLDKHINLTTILPVADANLSRLFFHSPAKNLCFVGTCKYYCDTTHAICGRPYVVEASVQVFLPHEDYMAAGRLKSPFARTYSKKRQRAVWQLDSSYCENFVKNSSLAPYLLDMVDAAILDFLTGNQDRHHFEFVELLGRERYFIHIDNGRAFGRSNVDDADILAPLTQCCLVRPSTFANLLKYYNRPCSLARTLNGSMSADPLAPLLADKHLAAVERRLEKIIAALHGCIFVRSDGDHEKVVVKSFSAKVS